MNSTLECKVATKIFWRALTKLTDFAQKWNFGSNMWKTKILKYFLLARNLKKMWRKCEHCFSKRNHTKTFKYSWGKIILLFPFYSPRLLWLGQRTLQFRSRSWHYSDFAGARRIDWTKTRLWIKITIFRSSFEKFLVENF